MNAKHPMLDQSDGVILMTETRARIAYLSEARADLLIAAAEAERPLVLVSDEVTRLTYPMREALRDVHGRWVVREVGGTLRDGLSGARLTSIADAVRTGPPSHPEDVSVRFLRPVPAQSVQLVITQSVRHKAAATTILGGAAELFARELTGAAPTGWGAHEPAVVAWDRARLTELSRTRMPRETTVMVAGSPDRPMIGTIRASRVDSGLEETTQLMLGVGAPGSDAARDAIGRIPVVMADLTTHQMPLFGLVLARTGQADLSFPSVLEAPPNPIGMLLGPPGVRELGLDVSRMAAELDARVVGRARIPGLYLPLGSFHEPGWAKFDAVLDALGPDRVRQVLGSAGMPIEEALRAPRS